MLEKESLADLIKFSGGFTGKAYSQRLKVIRKTGKEQQMLDVENKYADTLLLTNGDEVVVDSVLTRFENRVEVKGAIYRPGFFSIENKLTLKELIKKAEGLRGDAFKNRISIYRTRENYTLEVVSVDLNKLYTGNTDIDLIKDDMVVIPSIFDLKEEYFIKVEGEVRNPGEYLYVANSSIEDIILQAGGLLESASMARVEVARRVKNPNAITTSDNIAEVYQFPITEDLKLSTDAKQFTLEPFDNVFIRRSPGYETQNIVTLDGELLFPGKYALNSKNERISDIITRAGGLTPEAFPKGAKLVRLLPKDQDWRRDFIDTMRFEDKIDSIKFFLNFDTVSTIGINLDLILSAPKSKYDLILQDNDILQVPKELQTVHLSGEILSPVLVRYDRGKSVRHYVSSAGGFTSDAKKGKVYIVYANGIMDRTRTIFFFKKYPKVEPGAEIVVPKKIPTKGMNTGEIIALSGTFLSAMSIVVAALIYSSNR
jgi:protein involved in polysaccharide export with SLBB domain